MIGRGVQLGRFEGGDDRPVGVGGEVGGGGLDDDFALRLKMAGNEAVHGDGVEFAQREIGGVGQVDDDNVEFFRRPFQPFGSIVVDDVHFWVGQRALVERA